MRKGTLTDAQTLGMYEDGVQMIALCVHEGMTPYGIISRLSRARRARRLQVGPRRERHLRAVAPRVRTQQPPIDTFDALRAAVERLEATTRELTHAV
jgi:hypothetical protein